MSPPPKKRKRTVMSIDLNAENRLMLDKLAKLRNAPRATLIRMMLKDEYDRYFDADGFPKQIAIIGIDGDD